MANYGLAGQYTVHTDAIYMTNDAGSKQQKRGIWNLHAGDRAATVRSYPVILKIISVVLSIGKWFNIN